MLVCVSITAGWPEIIKGHAAKLKKTCEASLETGIFYLHQKRLAKAATTV
jgi:hypothetical protein